MPPRELSAPPPLPLREVTLALAADAVAAIHAHAVEGYPFEVVGVLAGVRRAEPGTARVTEVAALVNERADSKHNRYAVSALTLHRAQQALEARGLDILGYYHTHPDHPAIASETDRDNALPNLSYVIVSVRAGAPVDTRSFVLRDDRSAMDEQPVALEPR